jgi:hypothetical protein
VYADLTPNEIIFIDRVYGMWSGLIGYYSFSLSTRDIEQKVTSTQVRQNGEGLADAAEQIPVSFGQAANMRFGVHSFFSSSRLCFDLGTILTHG